MFLTGTVSAVDSLGTAMTSAASSIQGTLGTAIEAALPVAGTILAVTIGWRLFRNFTRG